MIHVFLPAYNEEVALPRLIEKFDAVLKTLGEKYHITVLDDGSKDGTFEAAKKLSARYPLTAMQHAKNQGLGQTMVDGIHEVLKHASDDDVMVTMDCDDTHDPKYFPAALEKLRTGYDLVILSRFQKGGGQGGLVWYRHLLSKGAGLFLKFFFPMRGIWEYSCGYRVYRISALRRVSEYFGKDFVRFTDLGFVAIPEILVKFRMLGCRISESPFVLNYALKPGKSTMRMGRTIRGYFALARAYAWRKAKKPR